MERTNINNGGGYSIIHEEYVERERESRCFRRHEITLEAWRNMTERNEMRFWKARGVRREYTELGYMVVGYSRRRWGDGVKVLDRWHVVKVGMEFVPVDCKLDEILVDA
jgi:hypothetical protein